MSEAEPRALHLHTLASLIADLISGRSVSIRGGKTFALPDERTRSALEWYRKRGSAAWTANVSATHAEDLVDSILLKPPQPPPLPARPANANCRRLRLKRVEAHRFAGLHKFGTPGTAPENYIHEFSSSLTLLEGRNGSGKTSLLNAIIWALTGEMLRPQRAPEAAEDFECWIDASAPGQEPTAHKLSPLTPMPNAEQYRPNEAWVPADTWVELTFVDQTGAELPIVRSQSRSPQGKLRETPPDLSVLGIDPIAVRIGSIMPGLLPLIKVGSESELGRAVSQLTGLSALVDLAEHARRSKLKIDKEFLKAKMAELGRADANYTTAKDDLSNILLAHPALAPVHAAPQPSDATDIEQVLDEITKHFEGAKASAFESARDILGESFDPTNPVLIADLEKNISRALERASRPQDLPSATRLAALRQVAADQLQATDDRIQSILAEAEALNALAQDPSRAARIRLYARVATWIADHPDPERKDNACVVCGSDLAEAKDPVTGQLVRMHLHDAASDAVLLSQTIGRWAENAQGDLMRNLPEALRAEIARTLPAHPCDLLRTAIVDELFDFEPFKGVLCELNAQTVSTFDDVVKNRAPLASATEIVLPRGCDALSEALKRLDCAVRFSKWRQNNDLLAREIVTRVLGRAPKESEPRETTTLTGKLLDLQATAHAAKPISDALTQCDRLKRHLKVRRTAETRLREYQTASKALGNLAHLGLLADQQVDHLRTILRSEAGAWRKRIYLGAFPDTAHELIDAELGRKGELGLVVQTGGVAAPAQHVTNASALRASLVAFFLAFWEYVLKERGGLITLILDDPQELLDDENRERLASALVPLVASGAQLFVSSYDSRFCARVARLTVHGGIEHLEVNPATRLQPVIRTTPPLPVIERRRSRFEADPNLEEPAREFADGCRIFFEAKLGDMFDDPGFAAWTIANPDPTLATFVQRLRPLVKSAPQGMFGALVFRRFVDHPALVDGSPVLILMNKAHHGRRQEIRAADVAQCANDLSELLEIVEAMYEECYRWRRRDALKDQPLAEAQPPALIPMPNPGLNVLVCPDLAAFTQHAPVGESQSSPERLALNLFDNTVTYFLRRPNYGFAAPVNSLAIVQAIPEPVADRRLVIARYGSTTYARRLVRGVNSDVIGLTAEIPDPRFRAPKTIFLPETSVAIHQVVGIIFDHNVAASQGQDEAIQVDASGVLKHVEIAFRVSDDSAVPLALEKQVVLGGARIELNELGQHRDALVALTLDDGSSIFKRVGAALPVELNHLCQFESIGGLGSSQVLSIGKPQKGFRTVTSARAIIGVLYHG
ncbi:ATP-binding protein [Bradyrhizobium sp. LCT2]|uniref:ATP-binding protein n=1 Tax=Bradyrhizobium sp. LCT2 TaxID=2493093 RepID=UPI0013752274|nr:ATP-binding protein [Bradyrhizobium sp. LCT2]